MKKLIALIVVLALTLSCTTMAFADVSIAPETDAIISMRLETAADEVLAFYDSWAAQEYAAGNKPGEGFGAVRFLDHHPHAAGHGLRGHLQRW